MTKTNNIRCEECKFGIGVDVNERVLLCDNPDLKSYGKNVKHGRRFACGYGLMWNADVPITPPGPPLRFSQMAAISKTALELAREALCGS